MRELDIDLSGRTRSSIDRILDDYDHVPVRSHILTLAHKRTRDCLRQEHCDVLESTGA